MKTATKPKENMVRSLLAAWAILEAIKSDTTIALHEEMCAARQTILMDAYNYFEKVLIEPHSEGGAQ